MSLLSPFDDNLLFCDTFFVRLQDNMVIGLKLGPGQAFYDRSSNS